MGEGGEVAMPADSKQKSSSKEEVIPVAEPHKPPKVQPEFSTPQIYLWFSFSFFLLLSANISYVHYVKVCKVFVFCLSILVEIKVEFVI